jgi:hypothetical protein
MAVGARHVKRFGAPLDPAAADAGRKSAPRRRFLGPASVGDLEPGRMPARAKEDRDEPEPLQLPQHAAQSSRCFRRGAEDEVTVGEEGPLA